MHPSTSEIQELVNTGASAAGKLLEALSALSGPDLSEVLQQMEPDRVLTAVGATWRRELVTRIVRQVEHLSIPVKAALIKHLALAKTTPPEEKALLTLFTSEVGAGLTELKMTLDRCVLGHDLLALLNYDLANPELRFDVIKHFQTSWDSEAPRPLRVVSDIDDTIYSSLKDQRHPTGTIYPGVVELYNSLSEHPPIFLTARPELALSMMERATHRQLLSLGWEGSTVLSGSLPGLFGHRRMAAQKARTLISFAELFPEFRFVFFGDSGQSDWSVARLLLKEKPTVVERAFIHLLDPSHRRGKPSHPRIHFFETFSGAADDLVKLGVLEAPP